LEIGYGGAAAVEVRSLSDGKRKMEEREKREGEEDVKLS